MYNNFFYTLLKLDFGDGFQKNKIRIYIHYYTTTKS